MSGPRISREARQTAAVVALLQALPDEQLDAVLAGIGIHRAEHRSPAGGRRPGRNCRICGLPYPMCRDRWADDHDFEDPHRARTTQ